MMTDYNDLFLRACRKEAVERFPVWYMRQAGRYQPEYREIRKQYSLMEICLHPDVCAEVTTLPIQQLGVDAAILFSDIMVPVAAMGVSVSLQKDVGPVIANPIRTMDDVVALQDFDPEQALPYVLETIRILKRDLSVPLIGFAGGPFTLASYMIEGGPSRQYLRTKQLMYGDRTLWMALMDKLADMIIRYMSAQVDAGAAAIQIFDSWVGSLSPADFREYVLPVMQKIFSELQGVKVPRIYFGVGTGELLPAWREVGADVVGVDWRVSIAEANRRLGGTVALQGNLDPAVLGAPWSEIERRAKEIIDGATQVPGFIFNLGHGVTPGVDVDTLSKLTAFVHDYSEKVLEVHA